MFDEEIEELTEEVQEKRSRNKKRVAEVLQQAKAIVAVRVLSQGRDEEETMEKLVPLWEWLFVNRTGLLQADAGRVKSIVRLLRTGVVFAPQLPRDARGEDDVGTLLVHKTLS